MVDRIEDDLVALFHERAESDPPPPVPEALLTMSARPRRRAATLAAIAAAAVVVVGTSIGAALFVGSADDAPVVDQTGGPSAPDETPTAPRPSDPSGAQTRQSPGSDDQPPVKAGPSVSLRIPYIRDGFLRFGSAATPTTADQVQSAGTTVLATDNYSSQEGDGLARTSILRGEELVPLAFLDDSVVALNLDGTQVLAMDYPDTTTTRLTVYDLPQGTETGVIEIAVPGTCCETSAVDPVGFDASGRVFVNEGNGSFMWDPRTERPIVDVTGAPGKIVQVGLQGALAISGDFGSSARRVLGEVDESGVFVAGQEFTMPDTTETATWSPSGDTVAYSANAGPVVMPRDVSTGPVPLDVGDRVFSNFVAFESETDLLLVAREGNRSSLLRCSTASTCEKIADMGGLSTLANWVFPLR